MDIISKTIPFPVKTFPFLVEFSGAQGEAKEIWTPINASFEFAGLAARANDLIDLDACDGLPTNPIGFLQPGIDTYRYMAFPANGVYRALAPQSKLLLVDSFGGKIVQVKGVVYGWEVTQEGVYR